MSSAISPVTSCTLPTYGSFIRRSRMTVSVPSVPTAAPTSSLPRCFSIRLICGFSTQPRTFPSASDTASSVPSGPPPLTCNVIDPSSIFCILPIIDAALSKRPSAAVAVGSVLWICLARSTIPVEVMATAFTHPSFVIARTSSSFMSFPFSPRDKRAARPPLARGISGRRRRRFL